MRFPALFVVDASTTAERLNDCVCVCVREHSEWIYLPKTVLSVLFEQQFMLQPLPAFSSCGWVHYRGCVAGRLWSIDNETIGIRFDRQSVAWLWRDAGQSRMATIKWKRTSALCRSLTLVWRTRLNFYVADGRMVYVYARRLRSQLTNSVRDWPGW